MQDSENHTVEPAENRDVVAATGRSDRARAKLTTAAAGVKIASERHVSLAVSLRAAERNRSVAASVLAGGLAYRLFLWMLPFGLIVGGALGLMNSSSTEQAVQGGGIPAAVSNTIGDVSRSANSDSWWLLATGIPLLLWAGFTGAKAIQLIHSLVWDQPPPKTKPLKGSLAFTGMMLAVWTTVALTWWFRDETWHGILVAALTIAPFAGLWLLLSLHLPHRDAPWQALVPGALLIGIGFPVLHEVIVTFGVPQLQKSRSLYGGIGATTTMIFFVYLVGTLVVTAPVLNSALYHELRGRRVEDDDESGTI